jgi:putative transposase
MKKSRFTHGQIVAILILDRRKTELQLPMQIRLDNDPKLIIGEFVDWCVSNGIDLAYIQPDKPKQNGFTERLDGTFRQEFLNAYFF